jgi:ankyrin repeat protein
MSTSSADLIDAIRRGDEEVVAAALKAQPSLAASRDENGVSAFMWASYVRQLVVRDLLRAALPSLDVFEAIAAGDDERVLDLLAAQPALTQAWSGDGFTALHFAGFFCRPVVAERLLLLGADPGVAARNPMRVTPLHSAVSAHCMEVVRLLLARGVPADAQQQEGWTVLMSAATHGDETLADLLLAHGANPAVKADNGQTAADMAAEKGHAALAMKLRPA